MFINLHSILCNSSDNIGSISSNCGKRPASLIKEKIKQSNTLHSKEKEVIIVFFKLILNGASHLGPITTVVNVISGLRIYLKAHLLHQTTHATNVFCMASTKPSMEIT